MAQVLVRGLKPDVVSRLNARAKSRGHTLQAELKEILEQASRQGALDARKAALRVRRVLAKGRARGMQTPLSLPLERKRELFPGLAAELGRLLRKGRTSEREVLNDFGSWRKERHRGRRRKG